MLYKVYDQNDIFASLLEASNKINLDEDFILCFVEIIKV